MLNTIHHPSIDRGPRAVRAGALRLVELALLLAACDNSDAPPPNGKPQNWGQRHYLDVQRQREQNGETLHATRFTRRSGTTITFFGVLPSRIRITLSLASAAASIASFG